MDTSEKMKRSNYPRDIETMDQKVGNEAVETRSIEPEETAPRDSDLSIGSLAERFPLHTAIVSGALGYFAAQFLKSMSKR